MSASAEDTDVNLTPLLDLILQLIMFFMITINFVRVDQFDDSIVLPTASYALPIDDKAEKWIFLNLDAEGKLIGTVSTFTLDTPEKLRLYLERQMEPDIKNVVIVRADRNCKYTDVWTVLNSCQRAGFKHWQLRVMRAPGT